MSVTPGQPERTLPGRQHPLQASNFEHAVPVEQVVINAAVQRGDEVVVPRGVPGEDVFRNPEMFECGAKGIEVTGPRVRERQRCGHPRKAFHDIRIIENGLMSTHERGDWTSLEQIDGIGGIDCPLEILRHAIQSFDVASECRNLSEQAIVKHAFRAHFQWNGIGTRTCAQGYVEYDPGSFFRHDALPESAICVVEEIRVVLYQTAYDSLTQTVSGSDDHFVPAAG